MIHCAFLISLLFIDLNLIFSVFFFFVTIKVCASGKDQYPQLLYFESFQLVSHSGLVLIVRKKKHCEYITPRFQPSVYSTISENGVREFSEFNSFD